MEPDFSVNIAGIQMKNPIMTASGTCGYGRELAKFFDLLRLGAFVTKGVTLEPREGNDQPRMCETRAGLINFIGLQNPGIDVVILHELPFLLSFDIPVIINIAGRTIDDYVTTAQKLERIKKALAGIEVNISCPNVKKGGMAFGQDSDSTFAVVSAIRKETSLPLIVKLTPNVTDIVTIASSAVSAGANALSLINTLKSRAMLRSGPHKGKWLVGGLSGPAIKPVALQKVWEVSQAKLGVPIIGMGGIQHLADVIDFLQAGADAVAVGTATFVDPTCMVDLIDDLRRFMKAKGYNNIAELKEKAVDVNPNDFARKEASV